MKYQQQKSESGFALLISLIVVGVVISIGLSVLDLTIKQVRLSTNAKESELAFHAANAGMECARFWRRASSSQMEVGNAISPVCFGETPDSNVIDATAPTFVGDGESFLYSYEFTWGGSEPRCTQINTVVASSSAIGTGVTTTNMVALIPGYPEGNNKYCEPGARCSTVSVRGYNRPCNTTGGFGVVQREVLLQY